MKTAPFPSGEINEVGPLEAEICGIFCEFGAVGSQQNKTKKPLLQRCKWGR